MNFEEFQKFLRQECMYETIYDDSEGRRILVLRELDAFVMLNRAMGSELVRRLTDEKIAELWHQNGGFHHHFARAVERWLKGEK